MREEEDMSGPAAAQAPGTGGHPAGDLSALIEAALDKGDSYQRISDRARDPESGTTVSKPYLQKIVKNPPANPPTPAQLRAIAKALGKTEQRVKEAAASQWLEYEATELAGYGDETRIIVGHLAGMPEAEKRRWRMMIEADERARRDDE